LLKYCWRLDVTLAAQFLPHRQLWIALGAIRDLLELGLRLVFFEHDTAFSPRRSFSRLSLLGHPSLYRLSFAPFLSHAFCRERM